MHRQRFYRKKYPLIVGGSMMYVYQLLNGLTHKYNLIQSDRKLLNFILDKYSTKKIYKAIELYNPILVEKINLNDKYRIEKLLEKVDKHTNDFTEFSWTL